MDDAATALLNPDKLPACGRELQDTPIGQLRIAMNPAISVSNIDKWYGGTHALRGVSLSCMAGDVHAIAGENGAGKSTLVKIISGVVGSNQYSGDVSIAGTPVHFSTIRDAERAGVFLVHQELHIVPLLSVAEFLFLNREPRRFGMVDKAKLWTETTHWLKLFQLSVSPTTLMGELGSHEQQLVNIARAMTQGVKLLILDEPTASLTERETLLLFERIREFRAHGVTTLYISHRLAEFERIADAVTVMRDGQVVDDFRLERLGNTPRRVIKAMVGRDLDELYPKTVAAPGKDLFTLRNWSVAHRLAGRPAPVQPMNLTVRAGEVLGVFGLIGSGASELARSFFGVQGGAVSGAMAVDGRTIDARRPGAAIRAGVAYMPSDRKRDGLILDLPVAANTSLAALGQFTQFGVVDRGAELRKVRHYVSALKVRCESVEQPVGSLSGGNQQKVVAAKWLLADPQVFVFEEPTRGVDVNARIELYHLINEVAQAGKAVILISTDLPEVLGMADRILVMSGGRIAGEWPRGAINEEDAMLRASGEEVHA